LADARKSFTTDEWKTFLLRSVGIEIEGLSNRQVDAMLLRMVPFVERNYNLVELGPRGTGKSHLFQQVSPYAHLISGGKATVAKMFVNNSNGQRGLVCQYDVVCFDEVSGISFDQKDGVNIMKGYMESGEFSRGKESIRADGSIVLVGNFEVDVEHQQRIGHLFGPMPPEMKDDTAFMDRIHAFLPGWDVPKISKELLTNHFGLVSDFLSECWSQLRNQSRLNVIQNRMFFGGALSGRDTNAVNKTISGLLKLLYPGEGQVSDEDVEWAVRIAMEARRRVKEQQKRIGAAEFRNTHFSYVMGEDGVEKFVSTPELHSENSIGDDPLEPGQVWTISPGTGEEHPGLYRIEVNEGPGSGVKVLNKPVPPAFKESVGYAEQNLYARSVQLVGDKDPRQHEFTVQLRAFDASKSGAKLGMASLLALSTALVKKSVRGGLIIVGEINLGGSVEPVHNPVTIAEIAVEKGATALLMPVACRRQLFDLSDEMATKIDIQFYSDARDALIRAMVE
jgi:ATP-dependent Lon protease